MKNIGTTKNGQQLIDSVKNELTLFDYGEPENHFVPIVPNISSYWARHTWSTIAHKLNISSDVIAMALGHSPVNRTTFIYIKPEQSKVDEANRKVIDYFIQSL